MQGLLGREDPGWCMVAEALARRGPDPVVPAQQQPSHHKARRAARARPGTPSLSPAVRAIPAIKLPTSPSSSLPKPTHPSHYSIPSPYTPAALVQRCYLHRSIAASTARSSSVDLRSLLRPACCCRCRVGRRKKRRRGGRPTADPTPTGRPWGGRRAATRRRSRRGPGRRRRTPSSRPTSTRTAPAATGSPCRRRSVRPSCLSLFFNP
jgi:hypothetical protein